jgi:hypothetical protein
MKKDPSTARMLLSSSIRFITLKRTKYRKPSLPSVIQIGMSCKSSLELVLPVAGFFHGLKQILVNCDHYWMSRKYNFIIPATPSNPSSHP